MRKLKRYSTNVYFTKDKKQLVILAYCIKDARKYVENTGCFILKYDGISCLNIDEHTLTKQHKLLEEYLKNGKLVLE